MQVIVFDGPYGPALLHPVASDAETESDAIAREMTLLANAGTSAFVMDRAALPNDPQEDWLVDYNSGVIEVVPLLLPVPEAISDRQFAQGLAIRGQITEAEAIAWVSTGALPAAIDVFVSGLPTAEQFAARMVLQGATEFRRSHPLTAAFGQATGMDSAALDDFWRFCAAL